MTLPPAAARHLPNDRLDPASLRIRPQISDLPTENIAELAVRARELGGVIPLWYGEGDLVTPPFIREAAKRALDDGRTFYIPDMRGDPPLTLALSAYLSRLHGVPIAPDRSTIAPGGMQALVLALSLILDPGRNAVFVEPQWPNIRNALHMVGAEPRPVPLAFTNNDWRLDLDRVFDSCDARTGAIVLSTPANPTGWVASHAELDALLRFGRERGIWIVSDEVYSRLVFAGEAAPSILQVAEPEDLALSVNSFSKAWAMTGWRVGWLSHPASVAPALAAMTQYLNSGTAGLLQAGALAALNEGEALVAAMRERCRSGIAAAYEALSDRPGVLLPERPRGGMYVFFSLAGEPDSRAACRRILDEARVGLAPGSLFGAVSGGHLRMCICRDPGQLGTALGRLREALS